MEEQLKKMIGKEVTIIGKLFTVRGQLYSLKNVFGIAVFRGQRNIVQVAFDVGEIVRLDDAHLVIYVEA